MNPSSGKLENVTRFTGKLKFDPDYLLSAFFVAGLQCTCFELALLALLPDGICTIGVKIWGQKPIVISALVCWLVSPNSKPTIQIRNIWSIKLDLTV